MPDIKKNEELTLDDSIKQNKKGESILGVLEGPCADIVNPTRNGRFYSEELWENVFSSDIAKEMFECGGYLGELDHPADRLETCTEKVAICMAEPPVKNDKGQLIGKWDILDTPNGKIAYTLAKYGYKLGISSRGSGDITESYDGNEEVDPSTYDFQGFDLVLLPAVKSARLNLVTESLHKTLKQALTEAINSASTSDKKVMLETLEHLGVDYKEKTKEEVKSKIEEANNDGSEIIKSLQESLKRIKQLEDDKLELQEKLSVCHAKESNLEEQLDRYKSTVISLSDSSKKLKTLKEELESTKELLKTKEEENKLLEEKFSKVSSRAKATSEKTLSLKESLTSKNDEVKSLQEQLEKQAQSSKKVEESLKANIEEIKKNSAIKTNEYSVKLEKANNLVEKYKSVARAAVDKYISEKAVVIGVSSAEIKNKLPSNYSFNDIDAICESLKEYRVNLSKLPFELSSKNKNLKVKISEKVEPIMPVNRFDDSIDESLLTLANNYN